MSTNANNPSDLLLLFDMPPLIEAGPQPTLSDKLPPLSLVFVILMALVSP